MATCNIQELLEANPCLYDLNDNDMETIILQMLCNLRENLESGAEMTCDIATLLEQGACWRDLNPRMRKVALAQLLCDISSLA